MTFKHKIAAALISLPLFFSVLFYPCLQIRASASNLGIYSDYNASNWEEVGEDVRDLAQAYLEVLKSTALGNYFDEVTDIPISWLKLASDGTFALSPISGIYYFLSSNGVLEVDNTISSHSGRHRVGDEHDDVVVDSDTFKKVIDETDLVYYPTGRINRISWKTDKFLKSNDLNFDRLGRVTFLYQGDFFYEKNLKECYCALYYYDGTDYFYSQNGFHFYLDDWSDDSGGSGTSLFYDQYNFLEIADVSNDNQVFEDINGTPYIDFSPWRSTPYSYRFSCYSELGQYFSNNTNYIAAVYWSRYEDFARYFYPSNSLTDLRDCYLHNNIRQFYGATSSYCSGFYSLPVDNVPCDWGIIYSDQKFTMDGFGADIDTTKIPDNYYITVGGDTIYDYNITNPATGDTTTINNYITNNYTYITNQGGGEGGSTVNNYYDGATINNGDNHYYDGATINNGDNHYYDGATINNGDNITNNYNFSEGDTNFFTQIGVEIQNALSVAFVPSDGFMDSFNIDLRNALESKMPFVYDIGDIFDALFVDIVDDNLVYVSDINSDGSVDESSIIYPKWSFNVNFFGTDYELIYLDFSMYSESFFYIRLVVAGFTYLAFFHMLIKSLPSIIGGIGDLVNTSIYAAPYITERFSDVKGGD